MTYCMRTARNRGTTPYFVGGIVKEAVKHDTWMGRTVFEVLGFVRSPHATSVPDLQRAPCASPTPTRARRPSSTPAT